MESTNLIAALADAPAGSFDTKVDEQGRVKLSAEWVQFIKDQAQAYGKDNTAFVSLMDGVIRIYPWSAHRLNQLRMESVAPKVRQALLLSMQNYGAEASPDAAGKLTIPQRIREKQNFAKGQALRGWTDRGVLMLQTATDYDRRLAEAEALLSDAEIQQQLEAANLL